MINLPYDVARCAGEGCPARDDCARYTSPGDPSGWQAMASGWQEMGSPKAWGPDGCPIKIDNGRRKT